MTEPLPPCLAHSKVLRIPQYEEGAERGPTISRLESYLLDANVAAGDLAEVRLETHASLRVLEREWDALEGWQSLRRGRTDASIDEAKRQLRPELWAAITDARWLIARIGEEVDRLNREIASCSRVLTPARLDALAPADFRS